MTADRRNMDPRTLEMLLLLKYNKDLRSVRAIDNTVNKVIATMDNTKTVFLLFVSTPQPSSPIFERGLLHGSLSSLVLMNEIKPHSRRAVGVPKLSYISCSLHQGIIGN